MKKALFIAVHPDDETFGCGGTILKHKEKGDEIYWLIITNVDTKNGWDVDFIEKRQKEIRTVAELYNFDETYKLDFPTTKLDIVPLGNLISKISNIFSKIQPEIIYLPNRSDVHTDQQITFQAVYSCTKNFWYPFVKKVLMYKCLSETEFAPALTDKVFVPNVFVDITDYFEKKIEILQVYKSGLMVDNLPRSINAIKSLAQYRGSRIGKLYAEVFFLILEIV